MSVNPSAAAPEPGRSASVTGIAPTPSLAESMEVDAPEASPVEPPTSADARRLLLGMEEELDSATRLALADRRALPAQVVRLRGGAINGAGSPSDIDLDPLPPSQDIESSDDEEAGSSATPEIDNAMQTRTMPIRDFPEMNTPISTPLTTATFATDLSAMAGIPSEAATTRSRRVGLTADEVRARSERLRRVRERLQQVRERSQAALDAFNAPRPTTAGRAWPSSSGAETTQIMARSSATQTTDEQRTVDAVTTTSPPLTMPATPVLPADSLTFASAQRVATQLESIADTLRRNAVQDATAALETALAEASEALRSLEHMNAQPSSRPSDHLSEDPSPDFVASAVQDSSEQVMARVDAARARIQAHRARTDTDVSSAASLDETYRLSTMTGATIDERITVARARVAANRARLAELQTEAQAFELRRQHQNLRRTRPLPASASGTRNVVTLGRNQDTMEQVMHRTARPSSTGPQTAVEARHRRRGYHREDENGVAIDSETEEDIPPGGGHGALQHLWQQNEARGRVHETMNEEKPSCATMPATATLTTTLRLGCVGR